MENEKKKFLTKEIITALVIGLVIGLLIMYFIHPTKTVASVKGKSISQKELYEKLRDVNSISVALEDVDKAILDKECPVDDEMKKLAEDEANSYMEMYLQYGYTEEAFLEESGFNSKDDFINYLTLYYQRQVYYSNYLETLLEENAVQEYYEANSFGRINSKYILVQTSEDVTDESALSSANEIIAKLNEGADFDAVAEEYEEKDASTFIHGELGYIDSTSEVDDEYKDALQTLEEGKYTTSAVKIDAGYMIIYCIDIDKEKISLSERMNIVSILTADVEEKDSYETALMKLREENKLTFKDKVLKEKYEHYCEDIKSEEG